jgi:hypothetical protein
MISLGNTMFNLVRNALYLQIKKLLLMFQILTPIYGFKMEGA